jgi:gluconate 2-dehydrogenase alpha chain
MATLPKKDVVIVGYGAAGGPIATELAMAGYSVVALERGLHRTTAEFATNALDTLRWRTRGEMLPTPQEVPLTFRTELDQVAQPINYAMADTVGGSSVHWSGQSWRYYEDDFHVKSTVEEMYGAERLEYLRRDGANLQDWPLTYDDVEPFYDKVEYEIAVGGWPGNINGDIRPVDPAEGNPFEAPRQRDYPFRPLRDNATDLVFREGALNLGLNPFHVPTAITTEPYTSPLGVERAGCTYCTFCTGFGCWNGSKSSSLVALLPVAEETGNFELRANSHVLRINHENGHATSVEYIDLVTGEHHIQPGEMFYLGAYTYQNVRLLLFSGIESDGQVGKYFINRSGPTLSAIFDDRYLNGYNGPSVQRQGLDDYNGENNAEEKMELSDEDFFIRGAFIGSPSQRTPLETFNAIPPDTARFGLEYKEYLSENLNRYIGLQLLQEPMPYESSYIDLDPNYTDMFGVPAARVQRQAKENEIRMSRYIYQKAYEILEAAGASQIWGRDTPVASGTMTHDCGGLRMGADPSMSVTNRYCQMWEVPNIFIGGGAVLPTMSGHNPTETIWMLSYWTADAIKEGKLNIYNSEDFA